MELHVVKANRLWNAAVILKSADEHEEAERRFQEIQEDYGGVLREVYRHMISSIEKRRKRDSEYCKRVLAATCLAYRPPPLPELSVIADLPAKVNPETVIEKCGSFLTIIRGRVSLAHQSAKDYLMETFTSWLRAVDVAQGHVDISRRCIDAMSSILR